MCWTARYQDTAKRSWEIYPIGFLVPWSASCSDKNPRCNELQLGMVHELLVQGLCCTECKEKVCDSFSDIWWRDQSLSFVHMYGVYIQAVPAVVMDLSFASAYRSQGVIPFCLLGWRSLFVLGTLSHSVLETVQGFDGANGVCQKTDGEARQSG